MKQILLLFIAAVTLSGPITAAAADHPTHMPHQGAAAPATAQHADVQQHPECKQCGMNRGMFASSRILVTYADNSTAGTCSIACVSRELKATNGKRTKSIQVGDYDNRALIDARTAFWVIGGDQPGVMAPVATWAFGSKSAALAFVKRHGGKLAGYKEALAQAEKE